MSWYPLSVSSFGDEEIDAATEVLRSGWTTMGARVQVFEDEFAAYVGADHAVMVNSGSSADLLLALAMVEEGWLRPGDEVLVPAVTWPTQVWALVMAGLKPRLVDVRPSLLNTTVEMLDAAVTPNTRAISLVHLMGLPCDMRAIDTFAGEHGLVIFEDCCEALGATYDDAHVGTFGVGATHSFFFSHQMSTMEGGMVTTHDPALADCVRRLRSHGWTRHESDDLYTFASLGFNLRPTEIQGVLGLVQLRKLDAMNAKRNENYELFRSLTMDVALHHPRVARYAKPSWFGLPLFVPIGAPYTRDQFCAFLEHNGVETRPILGGNLARQPVAKGGYFEERTLNGADYVHDQGFFLGLHPGPASDIERLAELMRTCPT